MTTQHTNLTLQNQWQNGVIVKVHGLKVGILFISGKLLHNRIWLKYTLFLGTTQNGFYIVATVIVNISILCIPHRSETETGWADKNEDQYGRKDQYHWVSRT